MKILLKQNHFSIFLNYDYLIDHQDSFTFNLAHLLGNFDEVYVSNYFEINKNKLHRSSMVVFSPGPGEPRDYPKSSSIYFQMKGKKKILGICLGFQQILFNEKGENNPTRERFIMAFNPN